MPPGKTLSADSVTGFTKLENVMHFRPFYLYQTGTVQVDNSVAECAAVACMPAEELAIFAAVDGAAFLSDVVDGDVGSYTDASLSVDAGNGNLANAQLNINSDAVWAILFSVKMP